MLELSSGNFVVRSPLWDGAAVDTGAVTFGPGASGVSGAPSSTNSLVGSTAGDQAGGFGIAELTNGNYVVRTGSWDSSGAANVGAVTWGSGTVGVAGPISATNSLVGSTLNDRVGGGSATLALSNGNYVVSSPAWDGAAVDTGAVTWGDGTTGVVGPVSAANSLVGSSLSDFVGRSGSLTALTNGNFVVGSASWDGGLTDRGAATWVDGTTGIAGPISAANSLIGSTSGDQVGATRVALTNGNYVVRSVLWDGGAVDTGAVTWG